MIYIKMSVKFRNKSSNGFNMLNLCCDHKVVPWLRVSLEKVLGCQTFGNHCYVLDFWGTLARLVTKYLVTAWDTTVEIIEIQLTYMLDHISDQ